MTHPVLQFRNVCKTFHSRRIGRRAAETTALRDVSFSLLPQEILALVGESGAGKSTAGRMAVGLEPPDEGQVILQDVDVAALSERERRRLRRRTHMILQDPYQSLHPAMSVAKLVAEPLAIAGVPRRERRNRVEEALADVRLTPPAQFLARYPHELSGGQRQRVAFARALVGNPDLIVADEPVSMLDVSLQAGILELVDALRERHAIIFITHDLTVARQVADRIAVMYQGRLLELGPADGLIDRPQHPYTQALLAAVEDLAEPPPAPGPFPPGGRPCQLYGFCRPEREECRSAEPVLIGVGPGHHCAYHVDGVPLPPPDPSEEQIMGRRKLVFFASQDPETDPSRVWSAYHFGLVAHSAGLEAEVRLAGDAVLVLREDGLPPGTDSESLRAKMSEAVASGLFVSG